MCYIFEKNKARIFIQILECKSFKMQFCKNYFTKSILVDIFKYFWWYLVRFNKHILKVF